MNHIKTVDDTVAWATEKLNKILTYINNESTK